MHGMAWEYIEVESVETRPAPDTGWVKEKFGPIQYQNLCGQLLWPVSVTLNHVYSCDA